MGPLQEKHVLSPTEPFLQFTFLYLKPDYLLPKDLNRLRGFTVTVKPSVTGHLQVGRHDAVFTCPLQPAQSAGTQRRQEEGLGTGRKGHYVSPGKSMSFSVSQHLFTDKSLGVAGKVDVSAARESQFPCGQPEPSRVREVHRE